MKTKKEISNIPALIDALGWDIDTFAGHCMIHGLHPDTAKKLADGSINVHYKTMKIAAKVLGVSMDDLTSEIEIK